MRLVPINDPIALPVPLIRLMIPTLLVALSVTGCGGDDNAGEDGRPSIVVTTNVLGDVVSSMVGNAAEVTTIMPPGVAPHDFQASARQVRSMGQADLLIVNGAGLEEGLLDVIESAEADGVAVYEAISAVETLEFGALDLGHDHEHDHDDPGHGHTGMDPHFFTDPARMVAAARGIFEELLERAPSLDTAAVRDRAESTIAGIEALDAEVAALLEPIGHDDRLMAVNHDVFGYFADRYEFSIVGSVIPTGSTSEGASARDIERLAVALQDSGARAIFADSSSSTDLARTVAAEAGDVTVVELFTESLGAAGSGGETYITMMRTNAERISAALA